MPPLLSWGLIANEIQLKKPAFDREFTATKSTAFAGFEGLRMHQSGVLTENKSFSSPSSLLPSFFNMRLLNLASRNATVASRSATFSVRPTRMMVTSNNIHSTAIRSKEPTHSEESVKAEKHDQSPEELQKQTANKATNQFKEENHNPTASEEAAKADVSGHDPLPDHKKKKSSR